MVRTKQRFHSDKERERERERGRGRERERERPLPTLSYGSEGNIQHGTNLRFPKKECTGLCALGALVLFMFWNSLFIQYCYFLLILVIVFLFPGVQILDGLKFSLQKQYNEFMRRHPHFLRNGGSVSVIGHSLGSVLMFDLLREKAERDSQCQVMSSGIPTSDLLASPDSIDGQSEFFLQ